MINVFDTKETQIMSAEDFGGERDRSSQVEEEYHYRTAIQPFSPLLSLSLSRPLVRKGKITQNIPYPPFSLEWVNKRR